MRHTTALLLATERALLVARHASRWTMEEHLRDTSPECLAVDPHQSGRVYCGTWGGGLWRSDDGGGRWEPAGSGISYGEITAVAVSPAERGVVYAGTEPSAVFRSDNGGKHGASWRACGRSHPQGRGVFRRARTPIM